MIFDCETWSLSHRIVGQQPVEADKPRFLLAAFAAAIDCIHGGSLVAKIQHVVAGSDLPGAPSANAVVSATATVPHRSPDLGASEYPPCGLVIPRLAGEVPARVDVPAIIGGISRALRDREPSGANRKPVQPQVSAYSPCIEKDPHTKAASRMPQVVFVGKLRRIDEAIGEVEIRTTRTVLKERAGRIVMLGGVTIHTNARCHSR